MREKVTPDELKGFIEELEAVRKAYGPVIRSDPRIERPYNETLQNSKTKYSNVKER